jgi:hypothetical protein
VINLIELSFIVLLDHTMSSVDNITELSLYYFLGSHQVSSVKSHRVFPILFSWITPSLFSF